LENECIDAMHESKIMFEDMMMEYSEAEATAKDIILEGF